MFASDAKDIKNKNIEILTDYVYTLEKTAEL